MVLYRFSSFINNFNTRLYKIHKKIKEKLIDQNGYRKRFLYEFYRNTKKLLITYTNLDLQKT